MALPPAAALGFLPLFVIRMIQGSAGPAQYVMIGAIAQHWAPPGSSGTYLMLLSSHFQFGRVLSMPLAATFCASTNMGWPALYFMLGTVTVFAFCIFFLVFRDHPEEHPLVSEVELCKIVAKNEQQLAPEAIALTTANNDDEKAHKHQQQQQQIVPYRHILHDCVVWLVLLTYWSDEIGYELLGQFGPTYLNRVLGIDIRYTGVLSAFPYLLSVFVKILAGWWYSRLRYCCCNSERSRINVFTAISELGMALCFFGLALLPSMQSVPSWVVQIAYTFVNVFSGLDFLGVIKCSQRISQQFAHVLMAWNSIISSITVLFLPLAVTILASENSIVEWSRMFMSIGFFQTTMVVVFFVFCDSEPRKWTKKQTQKK